MSLFHTQQSCEPMLSLVHAVSVYDVAQVPESPSYTDPQGDGLPLSILSALNVHGARQIEPWSSTDTSHGSPTCEPACVMPRIMHSPSPRATQSAVDSSGEPPLALQSAHGIPHPALMQTHSNWPSSTSSASRSPSPAMTCLMSHCASSCQQRADRRRLRRRCTLEKAARKRSAECACTRAYVGVL